MTNSKQFSTLLIATFLLTFCADLKCADYGIIANKKERFYERDSFKNGACIVLGGAIGVGLACLIIAERERLCSEVTALTQKVDLLTEEVTLLKQTAESAIKIAQHAKSTALTAYSASQDGGRGGF